MPLSKQAKALYEAALRRKGLQPGKAVRQDPRTFVGPVELMEGYYMPTGFSKRDPQGRKMTARASMMVPSNTYWAGRGRYKDLEDELHAAIDAGIWERKDPTAGRYYRYYNDGDVPAGITDPYLNYGTNYNDMGAYTYRYPAYNGPSGRYAGERRELTRLGQLELEARVDEMIENDYKNYLRQMYQRFPNRAAVREEFPEEYNAMPYLEDLFPEE